MLTLCTLSVLLLASQEAPPQELLGSFVARLEQPLESGVEEVRFGLWAEGPGLAGGLRAGEETALLAGEVGPGAVAQLKVSFEEGSGAFWIELGEEGWAGEFEGRPLELRRVSDDVPADLRLEVDLGVPLPRTVDRAGLPGPLLEVLTERIDRFLVDGGIVGLSAAFLVEGEVVDVRSYGWQDFAQRIPASGKTLYRWASISKTLASVAALQLAEAGKLDLDADIRGRVPEFPEKRWPVSTRNLLRHQAGIVHYQHDPVITVRTYDDPNPFRSRILSLDLFKESPLLFEPGTEYSYSTHGYALLGAVVERAGGAPFRDQVARRIARPLGMTTLRPDFHQSERIPDRTVGYRRLGDGRVLDAGDSNVAWKLAGGGFVSTVEDLARFGRGLLDGGLLSPETQAEMTSPQPLPGGRVSSYGLGVSVGESGGVTVIGHSGSQRNTRTCLRLVPEKGVGVALMCNTEDADVTRLAAELLAELLR